MAEALSRVVGGALGTKVEIENLTRLPGGASKDTWSFSARGTDGAERRLILRAERAGPSGLGMSVEGQLLDAAARAGVPVPALVAVGADPDALGARFLIAEFVDGETIPRRILRDEGLAAARAAMTAQCGRILADIHRIPPEEVADLNAGDVLTQLRGQLDVLGQPHPAFELGMRWLSEHRPVGAGTVVVHGDFRNGNFIVGQEGIRAVLDWELAHLGDPVEDLGWLCVKAWRFGSEFPVGGFGEVDDLLAAYEEAGGGSVDPGVLRWWVVYGTLRWGVICMVQARAHLSGAVRSVELAAIGRRVCEVESDLLDLLPWSAGTTSEPVPETDSAQAPGHPHDLPSAVQLLDAVRGYLADDVMPATEGRIRFHARVAANVVAMVAREIELGPGQAEAHDRRLRSLGVANEAELAAAIRDGSLTAGLEEVAGTVAATVADKLAVANPAYRTGDAWDLRRD